jgi:cytidyltransferase-like protein
VNVARSVAELARTPRAVALGTFDGVHLGHRRVIAAAVESGLTPTVITFDPHPRRVLGYAVEQLSTLERRLELLAELDVADTLVVEFTLETQRIEAEDFAEQYLQAIGAEVVVAGEDFRFGHRRRGDLALLGELGFDVRRSRCWTESRRRGSGTCSTRAAWPKLRYRTPRRGRGRRRRG